MPSRSTRRRVPSPRTLVRYQRPLSIGDSVMSGRRSRVPASRNPLLLPRSMAVAFPGRVKDLSYRAAARLSLRPGLARSQGRRPVNLSPQVLQRWMRLRSLHVRAELIRPTLNPLKSVCQKRSIRKSVMFSLKVAGKGWGSGGPNMQNARRSPSSQFRCS